MIPARGADFLERLIIGCHLGRDKASFLRGGDALLVNSTSGQNEKQLGKMPITESALEINMRDNNNNFDTSISNIDSISNFTSLSQKILSDKDMEFIDDQEDGLFQQTRYY